MTITNCTISGNTASSGNGIYSSGTLTITNSIISGNTGGTGGGIYQGGSTLTITNCTISGNTGGGIYRNYGTLRLYNTIVAMNVSYDIRVRTGTVVGHNNLSTSTDWSADSGINYEYDSNLPLFMDAENGDYRLVFDSQAIDRGSDQYAYNAGLYEHSLDVAGQPRFFSTIDIGSHEFYPPVNLSQFSVFRGDVTVEWEMPKDAETMRLSWTSGTTMTILGIFDADGSHIWDTTQHADAPGILKFEWLDEWNRVIDGQSFPITATIINDPSIIIHRNTVSGTETWSADKVHLVVGRLGIESGASITVAEDAIVKFWQKSYIYTASGSTLTVQNNAVFTRAEDDSIGGDTNKDGSNSIPRPGSSYIRGMETPEISPSATFKYEVHTRSGAISSSETWHAGQVIYVTGTINVVAGTTLTIESGVVIKFAPNCSIIVNIDNNALMLLLGQTLTCRC